MYPTQTAQPQSYPATAPKESRLRRFVKDPLSIVLILVIVAALGLAALLGGELYARHRGNSVVAKVVECVVKDKADASFGVVPPFLWQHLNRRYTNMSVETAGNQVLDAKGMKLNIDIKDVHLQNSADSAGTIGSLVATVNWTADGIKQTVQDAIPLFGGIVSGVKTDAIWRHHRTRRPAGHRHRQAAGRRRHPRPGGAERHRAGLHLAQRIGAAGAGRFHLAPDQELPMGIQADSVQVTDTGVTSQFSTQNATIPLGQRRPLLRGAVTG